jgi:hypothetical protein
MGLIEAYWKTEQAKHHLGELKTAVATFAEDACLINSEDDLERQIHRITFTFKEPHCWIHLIAGDFLYCLKSALDNAVFRLAKDSLSYPDRTQFPVIEIDNSKGRKRFAQYTRIWPIPAQAPFSRFARRLSIRQESHPGVRKADCRSPRFRARPGLPVRRRCSGGDLPGARQAGDSRRGSE